MILSIIEYQMQKQAGWNLLNRILASMGRNPGRAVQLAPALERTMASIERRAGSRGVEGLLKNVRSWNAPGAIGRPRAHYQDIWNRALQTRSSMIPLITPAPEHVIAMPVSGGSGFDFLRDVAMR